MGDEEKIPLDRSAYEYFIGKTETLVKEIGEAKTIQEVEEMLTRLERDRRKIDTRYINENDRNIEQLHANYDRVEHLIKKFIQAKKLEKHRIDKKTYEVYQKRINELFAETKKSRNILEWSRFAEEFRKLRIELEKIPVLHEDPAGAQLYAGIDQAGKIIRGQVLLIAQKIVPNIALRAKKTDSVAELKKQGKNIALLRKIMRLSGIDYDAPETKIIYDKLALLDAEMNREIVARNQTEE